MNTDDLRALLTRDELDYDEAAMTLGVAALPYLHELVTSADPMIAPKAVYLAALIDGAGAGDVLRTAIDSADPRLRVAAAHAARTIEPSLADDVLVPLIADPDLGVRRVALQSVGDRVSPRIHRELAQLASTEADVTHRRRLLETLAGADREIPDGSSAIGEGGGRLEDGDGALGEGGGHPQREKEGPS